MPMLMLTGQNPYSARRKRSRVISDLSEFVRSTRMPFFNTQMGKGAVDGNSEIPTSLHMPKPTVRAAFAFRPPTSRAAPSSAPSTRAACSSCGAHRLLGEQVRVGR
jgi:hypothetical protein